ncbi:hypothetical protein MF451_003727 [Salmonella enterica subsp. enterica serovar Saintpaul]|nr:hypothetical protein [Salmonella enterica subsp. enterica serovar Saintpaul]
MFIYFLICMATAVFMALRALPLMLQVLGSKMFVMIPCALARFIPAVLFLCLPSFVEWSWMAWVHDFYHSLGIYTPWRPSYHDLSFVFSGVILFIVTWYVGLLGSIFLSQMLISKGIREHMKMMDKYFEQN